MTDKAAMNYIQTPTIRLISKKPYWKDMLKTLKGTKIHAEYYTSL